MDIFHYRNADVDNDLNLNKAYICFPAPQINWVFITLYAILVIKNFEQDDDKEHLEPNLDDKGSTFWTSCVSCSVRFKFRHDILNKVVRCQICKKVFTAYELNVQGTTDAALSRTKTRQQPSFPQQNKISHTCTTKPVFEKKEPPEAQVNVNRKRKMRIEESGESSDSSESSESEESSESSVSSDSSESDGINSIYKKRNVSNKKNINDSGDVDIENDSGDVDIENDSGDVATQSKPAEKRVGNNTFWKAESEKITKYLRRMINRRISEGTVYDVPGSEFSDFDKNKSKESFKAGQIWASYNTSDSMPRFYAYIKKVVTTSPGFKLQIQWLKPDPVNDDENKWMKEDLPVSCGNFKRGRPEIADDILSFSHLVVALRRGKRGSKEERIRIIPRKGETWALFKNWSMNWHIDKERKFEYEFVEVLSAFDYIKGVRVSYLEKVKGFMCLFKRKKDGEMVIAGRDKYRFAHMVPSYKMNGEEREGVPKGSFELDPAGVPPSTFEQTGKTMINDLDHALEDLESTGLNGDLDFPKMPEIVQDDNHEPATVQDSNETVGLWRGNPVGQAAKELLEAVENLYPNTFQRVQTRFKQILLSTLKEFHEIIKGFLETSVDELTELQIISFREDLKEFERSGFDLSWAHKRLDMVEKLKFGNEPLRQELMALEESLEPLKERLVERQKQFLEARDMLEKAQLEYDNAKDARNNKAMELTEKFGDEYDLVLKGQLGFGMLPEC